jgi:hypothetical protein
MRRMIITAVTSAALSIPGVAVASHQGERQARERHQGAHHHKRHHRHAHLLRFGVAADNSAVSPSSPAPAASASDETAGTIASFANGTLTITLNDGSTVSGKVTEGTEIECRSAMASVARDDGQGDDNGPGDDRGDDGQSSSGPGDGEHGDVSGRDADDNDADDEDAQDEAEHCTSAALVAGAVVREAELRVSSAGAVWEKVELNQ